MAGKLGYSNVLIIQTEETVQEVLDSSRRIQCLSNPTTQLVAFQPLRNVEDVAVAQRQEIRTAVLIGTGLGGQPVNQDTLLKIGDPLTLVFYIHQDFKQVIVKNCLASNGQVFRIRLTDDNGCPLRPKLLEPFKRHGNSIYASLTTFRLDEENTLGLACEVELCTNICRNSTTTTFCPATLQTPTDPLEIQVPLTTPTTPVVIASIPSLYFKSQESYSVPVACHWGYPPCHPIKYPTAAPRYR